LSPPAWSMASAICTVVVLPLVPVMHTHAAVGRPARSLAVGNVGTPILDALRDPVDYDVLAVELSSFQLHWAHSLSRVRGSLTLYTAATWQFS
jgi:hypothetical protein